VDALPEPAVMHEPMHPVVEEVVQVDEEEHLGTTTQPIGNINTFKVLYGKFT
jgi:hypothetical protein